MSIPVTILGQVVLWPTTGDTNYGNATTQYVQLVESALDPIDGLYNTTTGNVGSIALSNSDILTYAVNNGTPIPLGSGSVTSIGISSANLTVSGSPVTTSGVIQVDLPNTAVTPASYTYANITVDAQGRITAASNATTPVTSIGISANAGITVSGSPVTSTGTITLNASNLTPTTVAASGTVTGSNLSGTNTGDQTLNSLLPSQTGNDGKFLVTDGSNASWSSNAGFVPYYIPVSTTFTVPLYKQALFGVPIINDGTLIVDGFLIGV